jgi:hypothetical protein
MRYLFGFLCVCALGVVPLVACWTPNDPNINPCRGVVCDDGNECTIDSCSRDDGTCNYEAAFDATACSGGFCRNGVCDIRVDQCTADDLAAIEAGDEPDTDAIADCMEGDYGYDSPCFDPIIDCVQDSGTALSDECSSCFAFQACCTRKYCGLGESGLGPCDAAPQPGDACDRCIQEVCQPQVDVCIGGQ